MGKRYEKRVQKYLRALDIGLIHCNQWIEFWDHNGPGAAETDAYLVFPSRVVLFDAKLTAKDGHWPQLEHFYAPLLEKIYSRPVHFAQIGRNIEAGTLSPIYHDVIPFLRAEASKAIIHLTI